MPSKRKITPEYMQKVREYNDRNYEKLTIMVPKGTKEKWKSLAKAKGISVTKLILEAVEKEKIYQFFIEAGEAIPQEHLPF